MLINYNKKQLNTIESLANKVMNLENDTDKLSNEDLKGKTKEFIERINNGESLDDILVEAFAVAREVSSRVLDKKHYKVQIMGGIALHQGRVIEMKTGEGKTLTELCPAYLNALTRKGVHIITVNTYLAERDKKEMEVFFNFLGLSVGLVTEFTPNKKEEYAKDIIYTTNSELGFDYLRDNLAMTLDSKLQRELNFVIIDEVDSVLIDEAKTPLIISAGSGDSTEMYKHVNKLLKTFDANDYELDEKENYIFITEKGIAKVEKVLGIKNLSDVKYTELNHIISQSLRANYMLEKNKHYIVKDNEVVIIDLSTGRIAEGRRFSDGLHQCLEAKEGLTVKGENRVMATITYQNFFSLYNKVAGMSGTVKTEELEFKEIYNLDVVVIPTNKDIKRVDFEDKIYIDNKQKLDAIIEDIEKTHENGNPILVGTPNIIKSEEISALLYERGITHRLLNAKTNDKEAEIISKAGEFGAITVVTNIAGRGTDIKISNEVENLGGLKVIGTERTDSRRVDNQLIGRAGRQGDSGASQFYLSCDDELLEVYGEGNLKEQFKKSLTKNKKLKASYVKKMIEKAQNSIKSIQYESRKYTLKYDFMVNKHRNIIYGDRNMILEQGYISSSISELILDEIFVICVSSYNKYIRNLERSITMEEAMSIELNNVEKDKKDNFLAYILAKVDNIFKGKIEISDIGILILKSSNTLDEVIDYITNEIIKYINILLKEKVILNDRSIRQSMLRAVDSSWVEHLDEMELLRKVVRDQTYNQKDPLEVYKLKSGEKFIKLKGKIRSRFIGNLFESIIYVNVED